MMPVKTLQYIGLGFIICLQIACEKLYFGEDKSSISAQKNFDYLWKEINEKYSFFDVKGVDWQAIHDKYYPYIKNSPNDIITFQIMSDMLNELKDGHVNLISFFRESFFNITSSSRDNFNLDIVIKNYIPNYSIAKPFVHSYIIQKIKGEKNIFGYVRLSSLDQRIDDELIDFILQRYSYAGVKGLILDLRENGGGLLSTSYKLLSRFVSKETIVYYTQIRNGLDHDDFSKPKPTKVFPSDGVRYTTKPVMVLVDRGSYSATSYFALATKAIDNIKLIGVATGGGLGTPGGGQLPNGWFYRFPVTRTLDVYGNNYEEGVPVDVKVNLNHIKIFRDEILDRAMIEIYNSKETTQQSK